MDRATAQGLLEPRGAPEARAARPAAPPARFDVATAADEPEVRRVLRDNPMAGAIRLSLEREPDSRLAAAVEGPLLHQTIVGRRPEGGLFGVGTRGARTAYVNGEATPLGCLGALRLDADYRARPRVIVGGYQRLRALHEADGRPIVYLTSILSDNSIARRLLEANVHGMPTYRLVGEYVTLVMRARRRRRRTTRLRIEDGSAGNIDAACELLAGHGRRFQFAPCWTRQGLLSLPGLAATDFRFASDGGRLVGCAAIWDQRGFKQTTVREYSRAIAMSRGAINLAARACGRPRLPAVGEPLRLAYVSHLATATDDADVTAALVDNLHPAAKTRGIDYLVAGFPAGDPRLARLRRDFGGRELHSRLYVVFWPDGRGLADALDGRTCFPEVALL